MVCAPGSCEKVITNKNISLFFFFLAATYYVNSFGRLDSNIHPVRTLSCMLRGFSDDVIRRRLIVKSWPSVRSIENSR